MPRLKPHQFRGLRCCAQLAQCKSPWAEGLVGKPCVDREGVTRPTHDWEPSCIACGDIKAKADPEGCPYRLVDTVTLTATSTAFTEAVTAAAIAATQAATHIASDQAQALAGVKFEAKERPEFPPTRREFDGRLHSLGSRLEDRVVSWKVHQRGSDGWFPVIIYGPSRAVKTFLSGMQAACSQNFEFRTVTGEAIFNALDLNDYVVNQEKCVQLGWRVSRIEFEGTDHTPAPTPMEITMREVARVAAGSVNSSPQLGSHVGEMLTAGLNAGLSVVRGTVRAAANALSPQVVEHEPQVPQESE